MQRPYPATKSSMRVYNPIRATIDTIVHPKDSEKELIPLSIGDPTVFGNMLPHESIKQALHKAIDSNSFNGYFNAAGSPEARQAVAKRYSSAEHPLTESDVILASGCSGALVLAFTAIAGPGDNILLPRPGFSLYPTICAYLGVECRYYNLLPEKGWDVDLEHLKSLQDDNTKAVLVNNPSNPCGSVWSKEHMLEILDTVRGMNLPLISDEVYFDMVFHNKISYSFGHLSEDVPVIVVGGLAKRYLVPGWRVGWVLLQDRHSLLSEIRQGMYKLAQLILGANSLVQAILPEILHHTPEEFYKNSNKLLEEHADYLVKRITAIDGMEIIPPGGAMYIMVKIEVNKLDVKDDVDFTQKLLTEENVFVLPGTIFGAVGYIRLVVCSPLDKLELACDRMEAFCKRHFRN